MQSVTASKVTTAKTAALYEECVLGNYGPPPFALVRGQGSHVWDAEGRRYLDFVAGIAVNTVGHSHPKWVEAIARQAAELVHVSNLFGVPGQGKLAQRLCEKAGPGRVFFCNSGAEANEFLIKLARLWGAQRAGGEEGKIYKIVTAENAFHGRTFGGMSATPQAKIQKPFGPLVPGFVHAPFNDLAAFEAAVDDATAAILVETIQGEGGVNPAEVGFLQGLRKLCDERGLLLLIDEVQCGIARTGTFFAFEEAGIRPDAIGMAKGLGGGFPIGAGWVREGLEGLFKPGSHGTTFGGSPLACAAANAVLDLIEEEELMVKARERGAVFKSDLEELVAAHPLILAGVRGRGFHLALVFKGDPLPWVAKLREYGLLTVRGGADAIRLMPPLTVSPQELETCVEILDQVLGAANLEQAE